MKTKTITTLIALVLIFAACTGEAPDPGFHAETLNLIIPDHPTAAPEAGEPGIDASSTRVHWNTPSGHGQWEDGDILYINVFYGDAQDNDIGTPLTLIARRDAGQWVFNNTIPVIAGAASLYIYAHYTVPYSTDDAAVNSFVLFSTTETNLSTITGNTIALNAFTFIGSRVIFTGLTPGDKVSFKDTGNNWFLMCLFSVSGLWDVAPQPIPTLTAGADGTITLYVAIPQENTNCYFRINNQPAGDDWYTFNPGAIPDPSSGFKGLSYTIDCTALR